MTENDATPYKRQRATRKGRLSTLQKQLRRYEEKEVPDFDLDHLRTILKEISKEFDAHTIAQDKILDIVQGSEDPNALEDEAEVAATYDEMYHKARRECEYYVNNLKLYREIGRFLKEYERWIDVVDQSSKAFIREASSYTDQIKAFEDRLDITALLPIVEDRQRELSDIAGKIMRLTHVKRPPAEDRPTVEPFEFHSRINIEPPTFHGNPLKWPAFRRLFESIMNNRAKHLDDAARSCLLLKALRDTDAYDLALLCTYGEDGYNKAMTALETRYGRPEVLLPKVVQQIKPNTTFNYTSDGLFSLSKQYCIPFDTLKEMRIGLSAYLTAEATTKFDPKLKEEWGRHVASMKDLPTMDTLKEYIEKMSAQLDRDKPNQIPSSSQATKKPNNKSKSPSSTQSTATSNQLALKCPLCQERPHSLTRCSKFMEMTPDQRGKAVRDNHWCNNCLFHSHTQASCTSRFTCKYCGQRHHSLLHKGDTSTVRANQDSSTAGPNLSVTLDSFPKSKRRRSRRKPSTSSSSQVEVQSLPTAIVDVPFQKQYLRARVVFDTGSVLNFITETMASRLRLKRYPQRVNYNGAVANSISRHHVKLSIHSRFDPSIYFETKLSVLPKLPKTPGPDDSASILAHSDVKDLQLADEELGGNVDILIGSVDFSLCKIEGVPEKRLDRSHVFLNHTIFGWTVIGKSKATTSSPFLNIQIAEDNLESSLTRLWELEKTPDELCHLSEEDQSALEQFRDEHEILPSGRYMVKLPRPNNPPSLGSSRHVAIKRFHGNEKSMSKRGSLEAFNTALSEYITMDHAEIITFGTITSTITNSPVNYLPVHGVVKSSSTTTKLRPVFDASAKTSSGASLNDTLLTGPNLYPHLVEILIMFRTHLFGMSADISKMFREIMLHPDERNLHRFLMRSTDDRVVDCRMKRLTFGVRPSPFLATQVLRHLAETHQRVHPIAADAIIKAFYVDDYLGGADSIEEAQLIRQQLCDLLSMACMTLRKWRSSNPAFLQSIPTELVETEPLTLTSPTDAPKALGIHWDVSSDTLHLAVPSPSPDSERLTKRLIASMAAQVYDVLGLFAPYTIAAKIILQTLWKQGLSWDEDVTAEIKAQWSTWTSELATVHSHPIPRRYRTNTSPIICSYLHGFSDASEVAYGAAVYLRTEHQDGSTSVSLVYSKARVLPVKAITIPRAELVGAHLLAKLLSYTQRILNIPSNRVYAWTDSTIVLCWLRKQPSSLKTFASHRVAFIQEHLPEVTWRHVPTDSNPADLLSRGTTASILLASSLWWEGPSWLMKQPTHWPNNIFNAPRQIPEIRAVTLIACPATEEQDFELWNKYSSFQRLTRIIAWCRRFANNAKASDPNERITNKHLTASERDQAELLLMKKVQSEAYPDLISHLEHHNKAPSHHPFRGFNLTIDDRGLLLVAGRVREAKSGNIQRIIPLSIKSDITRLMIESLHKRHHHPGTSTLLAIIAETHHIPALKPFLKHLSRRCVQCQKAYAHPIQPSMGLLPSARTEPTPPFSTTGLDFAGPFTIRKGHTRKPVLIKAYACLFVCFSTRAIHLELCSDLSTQAFLAALSRFCARRGTPSNIHSDNGSNFIGAATELRQIRDLLATSQDAISQLPDVTWHFIPPRAPHFGGLWEAGVRQMKILLKKHLSPHPLTFEELETVLIEAEATLNSRPLTAADSTDPEDIVLTPGHFLIGRPIRSRPSARAQDTNISYLKKWQLTQRLTQDLWTSWQAHYRQSLQARAKWNKSDRNLKPGDIVLVKDETLLTSTSWPLARVIRTYPGDDNQVRTVDLQCNGRSYSRAANRLIYLLST